MKLTIAFQTHDKHASIESTIVPKSILVSKCTNAAKVTNNIVLGYIMAFGQQHHRWQMENFSPHSSFGYG